MNAIETTEQAEALPVGTVIRTGPGRVAERVCDEPLSAWRVTGVAGRHNLFNDDLPATVLHDPTQPAPAGVIDREAIVEAIDLALILAASRGTNVVHDLADAVLAVLPTRTVAQVKAEALREVVEKHTITILDRLGYNVQAVTIEDLLDRADELEREDKR